MKRTLAMVTAITAFAAFPLNADSEANKEAYAMRQGGAWPRSWPKELDSFRGPSKTGLRSWTFQRSREPLIHYGIRFLTREEFEAAWPHLLKVKSKGAPIILRRGASHWLGGAWSGVCVHTSAVGKEPLSEEELNKSPWKTTNSIELIVDGDIVDLNRISLPSETSIIDERFPDTGERDKREAPSDSPEPPTTPPETDDTTTKPMSRELRDFASDKPVLSMYDHVWVQVTEPAKTEAIKKELAKYGRLVKGHGFHVWGVDVYDDIDTEAVRAALAKLDGVGETGTHKRGAYDKRIPGLKATLEVGKKTYAVNQADGLDLTFVLTNMNQDEPREFRSIDSHLCQLDLKLEGPGSQRWQMVECHESILVLRGKVIRLGPGKSYQIPMTNLLYGDEYSLYRWNWAKPGEYTLIAAYIIGEVRYEAEPLKLEVVGP